MRGKNLEKLLESNKDKVAFVASADNTLDSKAGTLMAFEIAIAIGYLSLIFRDLNGCNFWLGVSGLALLGVSIAFLFYVNWPKKYITASVNIRERKEYLTKRENELLLQLISDAQNAFTKNSKILERKTKCYKVAIFLLIMSTILLALSIL